MRLWLRQKIQLNALATVFASNAAQPILDFPSNVSLGTNSIRIGVKLADLFGQEIGCVAHAQSKSRKFVIHSDEKRSRSVCQM